MWAIDTRHKANAASRRHSQPRASGSGLRACFDFSRRLPSKHISSSLPRASRWPSTPCPTLMTRAFSKAPQQWYDRTRFKYPCSYFAKFGVSFAFVPHFILLSGAAFRRHRVLHSMCISLRPRAQHGHAPTILRPNSLCFEPRRVPNSCSSASWKPLMFVTHAVFSIVFCGICAFASLARRSLNNCSRLPPTICATRRSGTLAHTRA
jgi:hypothetical protein